MFASCKKEDTAPAEKISAAGVWSFFSYSARQNNNPPVTYTSTDHPCLSKNKLNLNSDGTLTGGYTGNDTCYLVKTSTSSFSIGQKGDGTTGTWSQNGETISLLVLGTTSTFKLQTVNGILELIGSDTSSNNTIVTTIFRK